MRRCFGFAVVVLVVSLCVDEDIGTVVVSVVVVCVSVTTGAGIGAGAGVSTTGAGAGVVSTTTGAGAGVSTTTGAGVIAGVVSTTTGAGVVSTVVAGDCVTVTLEEPVSRGERTFTFVFRPVPEPLPAEPTALDVYALPLLSTAAGPEITAGVEGVLTPCAFAGAATVPSV